MRRALREAAKGDPSPNPHVGAVLVKDGCIVSVGHHERAGQAHAEVAAIRAAPGAVVGATLYVTFEPCNHHGRTPPCTEAIIAAGIREVVIGCRDAHPHVPGAIERLESAGIVVRLGVLGDDAEALVADFLKHHTTRVPYVVAKAAITLDGRMATASGSSKWITGPLARKCAQRMRSRADAVLVGVGTVLADDPALTVRDVAGRSPLRVVLDTRLRTPIESTLVVTAREVPTLVFHGSGVALDALQALHARGVETAEVPLACGHVDPATVLEVLGRRDVVRLLVEGGAKIHDAFFRRGLVDRVATFVAPKFAGDPAASVFSAGASARAMSEALVLERVRVRRLGPDVLIEGDVPVIARQGARVCSPD